MPSGRSRCTNDEPGSSRNHDRPSGRKHAQPVDQQPGRNVHDAVVAVVAVICTELLAAAVVFRSTFAFGADGQRYAHDHDGNAHVS